MYAIAIYRTYCSKCQSNRNFYIYILDVLLKRSMPNRFEVHASNKLKSYGNITALWVYLYENITALWVYLYEHYYSRIVPTTLYMSTYKYTVYTVYSI